MLERMGIDGAQSFSSGELVEIANLVAERDELRERCEKLRDALRRLTFWTLNDECGCLTCDGVWPSDGKEQHNAGCLAALTEKEGK